MTTNGECTGKRLNQFGDYEDISRMTAKDWDVRWQKAQTKFHMPMEHPALTELISSLTGNNKGLRFFLPLCGKSVDMKWLDQHGHEVVGLECSELGCKEFFEENNIPYETQDMCNCKGTVFKATDGKKITIYCCDFFEVSKKQLGTFDCVWDRGSFVAIPIHRRQEYSNIISELVSNKSRYLLDCFLVDNTAFQGPPFNCTEDDVDTYFGNKFNFKKVKSKNAFTKWQESWGIKSFVEEVYMLTLK